MTRHDPVRGIKDESWQRCVEKAEIDVDGARKSSDPSELGSILSRASEHVDIGQGPFRDQVVRGYAQHLREGGDPV